MEKKAQALFGSKSPSEIVFLVDLFKPVDGDAGFDHLAENERIPATYYISKRHIIFITSHLLHVIVMPTFLRFFQALDKKTTQLNQKR